MSRVGVYERACRPNVVFVVVVVVVVVDVVVVVVCVSHAAACVRTTRRQHTHMATRVRRVRFTRTLFACRTGAVQWSGVDNVA